MTKKVMMYLEKTKRYMLRHRRIDWLEVVGSIDCHFVGCQDRLKSTSSFIFMLVREKYHGQVLMKAEFVAYSEGTSYLLW